MKISLKHVGVLCLFILLIALPSVPHVQAEALGPWTDTTPYFSLPVADQSCAVYGGYIYCIGGSTSSGFPTDAVYSASVSSGGVGLWTSTTAYPTGIGQQSCATYGGYIYCVGGGMNGYNTITSAVYYASVGSGGVGSWISTTVYPTNISDESCAIYGGYIYCVGGYTGSGYTGAVYYASVSSGGSIGSWISTTAYPTKIAVQSCAVYGGYIYCVGGYTTSGNTDAVYYASVGSGGVGSWTLSTTVYPTNIGELSCAVYGGYIYCVGGYTGSGHTGAVYYASVGSGGVGAWASTTAYPTGGIGELSCAVYGGYIYCVGGDTISGNTDAVYYASVSSSGVGSLWISTTPYAAGGIEDQSCAIYGGYIYCIGGWTNGLTNAVYYASVSSSGVGPWFSTTPYPLYVDDQSCAIYSGYIYCVGGYASSGAVYYASVSGSGVGTWIKTTPYPTSVVSGSCVTYSGYIYCVGGNAVYYASVGSSGVGTWTSTTAYPTGISQLSCAIYGGYIYCVGGWASSDFTADVYYASVSSSGVGTWTSTTPYPTGTEDHSCATYGGYIYCVGGFTNSRLTADVYYASVSSSGVGAWASTTPYPTGIEYHSCATSGGYIYCVGGQADSGLTDAVYYAAILSVTSTTVAATVFSTTFTTSSGSSTSSFQTPVSSTTTSVSVSPLITNTLLTTTTTTGPVAGTSTTTFTSPLSTTYSTFSYVASSSTSLTQTGTTTTSTVQSATTTSTGTTLSTTTSGGTVTITETDTYNVLITQIFQELEQFEAFILQTLGFQVTAVPVGQQVDQVVVTATPVTMTVSYSVKGGGSPAAPTFNYVQGGVGKSYTLTTKAKGILVDAGSSWSVTPNPLTGSSSSEQWMSNQPLSGTASATSTVFTFHHQYLQTLSYSVAGGGSPTAPSFKASQFGGSNPRKLMTTPTGYWFDAGSAWSVTPNPLGGSTGSERWWTVQAVKGTISSAQTINFQYQQQYKLTMNVNPSGAGTVSPGTGWENSGLAVNIQATANVNYAFLSWTGSGTGSYSGTSNPGSVTMNGPVTETVNFQQTGGQLSVSLVSPKNGGTVTSSPVTFSGKVAGFVSGATVTVYVDGSQACSGSTNASGAFSCKAPVTKTGSTHTWYAVATMTGFTSGTSPTWTFTY